MKNASLAFVALMFVAANFASAEMVDIGLGEMEQSDLMALKAKVQGQAADIVPGVTTLLDRPQRYGMVEMTREDFKSLVGKMAGHQIRIDSKPAFGAVRMVDIGTGEMPMDEFIVLKNMVEGTDMIGSGHLAVARPQQAVEKRHERRQDKAKFGEKAQFMVDK